MRSPSLQIVSLSSNVHRAAEGLEPEFGVLAAVERSEERPPAARRHRDRQIAAERAAEAVEVGVAARGLWQAERDVAAERFDVEIVAVHPLGRLNLYRTAEGLDPFGPGDVVES